MFISLINLFIKISSCFFSIFVCGTLDIIDSIIFPWCVPSKYSYTYALAIPVIITLVLLFGSSILCVILAITPYFGSSSTFIVSSNWFFFTYYK